MRPGRKVYVVYITLQAGEVQFVGVYSSKKRAEEAAKNTPGLAEVETQEVQ